MTQVERPFEIGVHPREARMAKTEKKAGGKAGEKRPQVSEDELVRGR